MGRSSNSDNISRGVHTTEPVRITDAILQQSSTEEDNSSSLTSQIYDSNEASTNYKYNKIDGTVTSDAQDEFTESGEGFRDLYQMKAETKKGNPSPSKIEFKRCNSKSRKGKQIRKHLLSTTRKDNTETRICACIKSNNNNRKSEEVTVKTEETPFFSRLKNSFNKMRKSGVPQESASKVNDDYTERMDIYYFDHGNSAYFRTTDCPPQILSEIIANQTTHYATRFWAEIFGSLHIGMTFFVTFFMQAYRFLLYSIARPILVGFLQMTSDYLVKPVITIIFNGLLQPPLILVYNILSSIQDMLRPIAGTLGDFLKPIAGLFRAIRLVSFTNKTEMIKTSPQVVV